MEVPSPHLRLVIMEIVIIYINKCQIFFKPYLIISTTLKKNIFKTSMLGKLKQICGTRKQAKRNKSKIWWSVGYTKRQTNFFFFYNKWLILKTIKTMNNKDRLEKFVKQ
jgi:hypothetical protein